jgi:hypothetical protein
MYVIAGSFESHIGVMLSLSALVEEFRLLFQSIHKQFNNKQ